MTNAWYEEVEATTRITQGDMILNCPLIAWSVEPFQLSGRNEAEVLRSRTNAVQADVVVMTQACDLEYEKVSNVVLCAHVSLAEHREMWAEEIKAKGTILRTGLGGGIAKISAMDMCGILLS